jgi:hypothetical protein
MALLTDLLSEDGFQYCPVREEVLEQIKRLTSETPVLRPISHTLGEQIFLFTDVSKVGPGA